MNLAWIDRNLMTLAGIIIALASLGSAIAGLLPAPDAAVLSSVCVGGAQLGRAIVRAAEAKNAVAEPAKRAPKAKP